MEKRLKLEIEKFYLAPLEARITALEAEVKALKKPKRKAAAKKKK